MDTSLTEVAQLRAELALAHDKIKALSAQLGEAKKREDLAANPAISHGPEVQRYYNEKRAAGLKDHQALACAIAQVKEDLRSKELAEQSEKAAAEKAAVESVEAAKKAKAQVK